MVATIRKNHPERVSRTEHLDPDDMMSRIGVTYLPPERPLGYLRLYPQDFIVEEIRTDGSIARLADTPTFKDVEDQRTLWVDCIKAGIAGPHAMTDIANGLRIPITQIGYAGIKDAVAVTSQVLSLRGVTREQADAFAHERVWLRPVKYGSGAVQPGDLQGNRFTILVRTDSDESIDALMEVLGRRGFYNFFGPQRFGPRIISHKLGQRLLINDVDGALKLFFGEPGPADVPLYRDARLAMGDSFGRWDEMIEIASYFPYSMRDELTVLRALKDDPKKTRAALHRIPEQVKLWVYAYGSWVMNRHLSERVKAGKDVSPELRLPYAPDGLLPEYADMMREDGTTRYLDALALHPFIRPSDKSIPSMILPTMLHHERCEQGWIIRFALGKGAYATSCLSHVFRLVEGLPVPSWVPDGDIDTFEKVGDMPLGEIRSRFAEILVRRDRQGEEDESE